MVTTQLPVPLQPPPLQPLKAEPLSGVAESVTVAPELKLALQVAPQLMPAGLLLTVPLPVPALLTVRVKVLGGAVLKVALTDLAASIVTVQLPVPLQAPPHPANTEPEAGVGVRVTEVPWAKLAEQVTPQLIPAGLLVRVPEPVPDLLTLRAKVGAAEVVKFWVGLLKVPASVTKR
jgi:hypothetical protein